MRTPQGASVQQAGTLLPPLFAEKYKGKRNQAQLAVIDSLICAQADVFLGTRRSMFTSTIFEERILFGHAAATARYM